jgi:7-cyano-7-deazaguanine synthase in queuosine biosynthesis
MPLIEVKSFQDAWEMFRDRSLPPGMNDITEASFKAAFFAGAAVMATSMKGTFNKYLDNTPKFVEAMEEAERETIAEVKAFQALLDAAVAAVRQKHGMKPN